MAITSSAKRAIRVSARKRVVNLRRMTTMRDEMKTLRKMAESGKGDDIAKALPGVYRAIDKAAKRGSSRRTPLPARVFIVAYVKKQLAKPAKAEAKPKTKKVAA